MDPTFVMMTAVPFYMARQQSLSKMVFRTVKAKINKSGENEETPTKPLKKRLRDIPIQEKMHMRKLKNRISAQVSRNRVQLQKDLMKQKLADLNYEKMKLLLENEALEKQNAELEKENDDLKLRVQNMDNHSESEENSEMEVSIKHASFVNIPLQKEWVLSNIFFTLVMISMLESLKVNFWIPCLILQHNWNNSIQSLLHLVCLPWKVIIHHFSYPQSFMVFNS